MELIELLKRNQLENKADETLPPLIDEEPFNGEPIDEELIDEKPIDEELIDEETMSEPGEITSSI